MRIRSGILQVGDKFIQNINEVSVVSSWKNLTDTCTVKLPRRYNSIMYQNEKTLVLDKILKTGSVVELKLGYDFILKSRFKGYLKAIKPNYPIELEMEDQMYVWKRTKVGLKAFRGGNVADILTHLGFKEFKLFGDTMMIGDFLITEEIQTVARCLEKLKEASGFPVFLRKGILHVGGERDADAKNRKNHKFTIGRDVISHSLEYKLKEDIKIQVEVISKQPDGQEIKVLVGEKGADVQKHTKNVPGIKDVRALEKIGYAEIEKTSYTGWRGKIVVFGEPIVLHGDTVELDDIDDGIIKGKYFVDTVEVRASTSTAYTQEIELGQIVS